MKRIIFTLMCLLALLGSVEAGTKKKVHTIGDSTMQTYADTDTKRGWGQMLQQFFNVENVTVNNRGKSGASSKSFYKEDSFWPTLVTGGRDQMQSGDILIIQFAHNDEKSNGTDGDEENAYHQAKGDGQTVDYRGTTPYGTFKQMLRNYIDEAKRMGVKPVLCGPICRKYFTGNTIRRNGRHDLGDNFAKLDNGVLTTGNKIAADDHTMDYVWQMQQVALEYDDVPFIDLTTATANMYLDYGEAYCTSSIFCPDDSTHPGPLGATLIARLFATLVHNQANGGETDSKRAAVLKELDEDIVLSSDISFSPVTGDMGKTYVGQSLVKDFNVSAFGLTPSEGIVKFTVEAPYTISLDKQNYSNSLEVNYDGSTLITQIYVKVTGTNGGKVTGKLTASNGQTSSTLDLTTEVVSLTGGESFSVTYPLAQNADAVVVGPGQGIGETFAEMESYGFRSINNTPMQFVQISGQTADGSWPAGEIDEVSTRYVQFAFQAPEETTLNISNIMFDVAANGGNGMRCKAYYSTSANFDDPQQIYANVSMVNKEIYNVDYSATLSIEEGERLYVRIYPWYNGAATGKWLAIGNVGIKGTATKAGGQQIEIEGAISYPLRKGGLDQTPEFDPEEMGAGIAGKTMAAGKALTVDGTIGWTGSDAAITMTKIYNGSGSSFAASATDDNTLTFTITPEDGFFFLPSNISFNAARFGTDGGTVTAIVEAGSAKVEVCSNEGVNRGAKDLPVKNINSELAGVVASAADPLKVKISFVGLGNTKSMGISDLVIDGKLQGAASTAVKYVLTTNVSPAGAGEISLDPELGSYKEGSEVTLKATKKFGYKFKEWQDADGQTVDTKAETTVKMDTDKQLTAVFETVPVYTVKTSCVNDADRALGRVTITPDENAGKFEEGTEITVKAEESKILKFMQWTDEFENAGTSATRKLTVNSDMTLVANYEVQDFIAVFDASGVQGYAYENTANYPYPADLTWDEQRNTAASVIKLADGTKLVSQSTGTPVVRNREGVVLAGINGLYQNGYATDEIAWQYEFSTKGFSNVTMSGDMAAKNCATKNWKALYSLDGQTYTDIPNAAWTASVNVANPFSIALPAEANGQDKVYVRFTGVSGETFNTSYPFDKTFGGMKYCDHSESGFGNLYVLGEAEVAADEVAPQVTSTLPANNSTGISATGTITISFDERIESGNANGSAMLNQQRMEPTWNSRSVSFQYGPLEYGQTYTFTMPAGYVQDKSGNKADAVTLTFTVMDRQKPQARTFNAIVDHSLNEKKIEATADMPAQYRFIQDAIDDAPSVNDKPYLIYIKEGYYADPNETFNSGYGNRYTGNGEETANDVPGGKNKYDDCKLIYVNKPNIHLIGQAVDKVTIATDRLAGSTKDKDCVWYHINASATLEVQAGAKDFYMENITLDNENWTIKGMQGPQALCVKASADRVTFNNMNVRSYQDTYYADALNNRQFWYNSTIEGAVDFIYGSGDVFFEGCTLNINRKDGGYIVAPNHSPAERWGYVFNNTTITTTYAADPSTYKIYFGRPWHETPKTVFLHTQCEVGTYDGYWYPTMGGIPSLWAVYDIWDKNGNKKSETSIEDYYYTSNGQTVSGKAKNYLTDAEAAEYTLANVLAGDGSNDADKGRWNPMPLVEKTSTPQLTQDGGLVTWNADEYAICYVVTVNGNPVAFPTVAQYEATEGDVITVQSVNEFGALSDMSAALTVKAGATGISELGTSAGADGIYYNLSGQRVSTPRRGVFIQNGKTFVVK